MGWGTWAANRGRDDLEKGAFNASLCCVVCTEGRAAAGRASSGGVRVREHSVLGVW